MSVKENSRFLLSSAVIAGVALAYTSAGAATITKRFDGGSSGNQVTWGTASSWSGDTLPSTTDVVAIDGKTATGTTPAGIDAPTTATLGSSIDVGELIFGTKFNSANVATLGNNTTGSSNYTITLNGVGSDPLIDYQATSGSFTIGPNVNTGTGTVRLALAKAGAFNVASNGMLAVTAPISGAFALTKTGGGTLALGATGVGNSTFAGLTISGGTVDLQSDNFATLGTTAGGLTLDGGKLKLSNTGLNSTSRTVTVTTNNGTIETASGVAATVSTAFAGTGTLTKSGSGTLLLTSSSLSTIGGLNLNDGLLQTVYVNALGSGTLNFGGGTLRYDNSSVGAPTLSPTIGNTIQLSAGGGTIDYGYASSGGTVGNLTLSGKISGVGGLSKTGSSIVTLSNTANDYSGGTTITAGTLAVAAASNLGSVNNTTTLAGGTFRATADIDLPKTNGFNLTATTGTVEVTSGNTLQIEGAVTGTGKLVKTGSGTLELGTHSNLTSNSSTNTFSGGIQVQAGTLTINGAGTSLGSAANIEIGDATLAFAYNNASYLSTRSFTLSGTTASTISMSTNAATTINGAVNGIGLLKKSGAGTLTLTNSNNTFTGGVTVSAGALRVNGTNNNSGNYTALTPTTLGGNGTINFAAGKSMAVAGTLSPGSADLAIGTLTANGDVALHSGVNNGSLAIDVLSMSAVDKLIVNGTLNLTGSSAKFVPSSTFAFPAPSSGDAYVFASYASLTGTFASFSGADAASYGINYDYNYSGSGLHQIALVAVPEPAFLSGITLVAAGALRRRRNVTPS